MHFYHIQWPIFIRTHSIQLQSNAGKYTTRQNRLWEFGAANDAFCLIACLFVFFFAPWRHIIIYQHLIVSNSR